MADGTAIGLPGYRHEAVVDPHGLVTPRPGGPSLDCWLQAAGGPLLAASRQPAGSVRQRMQGRLPVVATAFEVRTLRLATEAWVCRPGARAWVAVQAVVFNLSDDPARGHFYFAVRPCDPEGVAPIADLAYRDGVFTVDGRRFAVLRPAPPAWDCDPGRNRDLAAALPALAGRGRAHNPAGLCHGVAAYAYHIAPWEEAEFLAFLPLPRDSRHSAVDRSRAAVGQSSARDSGSVASYALLKGQGTRAWQARLDAGLALRLPDARLEDSWVVNTGHLLVLHDGDAITPGPSRYHQFGMRDAAYMLAALAAAGHGAAAWLVLAGYPARQHRDGRFAAPAGAGDATGQALWTIDRVDRLAPDPAARAALWPAVRRGAAWIVRARRGRRPAGAVGLLPARRAGRSAGPPAYDYWDNFWALAGLEAVVRLAGRLGLSGEAATWRREAAGLRAALDRSLACSLTPAGAIPAAPGRRADSDMVGVLAAWYPLALYPPADSRLAATLAALQAGSSYRGVFFQRNAPPGWGTYRNMEIAACLLRQRAPAAWDLVNWLLNHALPTGAWPEAIDPRTGSGSAGDGVHGRASAAWLLLLRDGLLFEEGDRLVLLAGMPMAWLACDGALEAAGAPTLFGRVRLHAAWQAGPCTLRLDLAAEPGPPGGYDVCLPRPIVAADLDGAPLVLAADGPASGKHSAALDNGLARLWLPPGARSLVARWA